MTVIINNPRGALQCRAGVELENSATANLHSRHTLNTSSLQRSRIRHQFGVCESTAGLIAYLIYGENFL